MGGALRASGVVGNLTGLGWVVAKTSGSGTGKGRGQKKNGIMWGKFPSGGPPSPPPSSLGIFTFLLLQKGSSLQEEILCVCVSVCLSVITFSFFEDSMI